MQIGGAEDRGIVRVVGRGQTQGATVGGIPVEKNLGDSPQGVLVAENQKTPAQVENPAELVAAPQSQESGGRGGDQPQRAVADAAIENSGVGEGEGPRGAGQVDITGKIAGVNAETQGDIPLHAQLVGQGPVGDLVVAAAGSVLAEGGAVG